MAYITPITDRDAADISAQNSKAFFNVVDWARVYGNSLETNAAIFNALGIGILFSPLVSVTDEVIPSVDTPYPINPMLANIERMRLWASTYTSIAGLTEVKDDWEPGQDKVAPIFTDVNLWEETLDLIYQVYKAPYVVQRAPITGVAISGAGLTRNNFFRG